MAVEHTLTSLEIREIGQILFGSVWQGEMAKAMGVPRQSVGYYLKTGGVSGAQAAAIIGVVARMAARELLAANAQQTAFNLRHADLSDLLHRFDTR